MREVKAAGEAEGGGFVQPGKRRQRGCNCCPPDRPPQGQPRPPLHRACSKSPSSNHHKLKQGESQLNKRTCFPHHCVVKAWDEAQRLWSPHHWRWATLGWRQPHTTCSDVARLRAGAGPRGLRHPSQRRCRARSPPPTESGSNSCRGSVAQPAASETRTGYNRLLQDCMQQH